MKNIKFIKTPSLYNPHGCIVAHISNINSKEELLKELNIKLKFPYFGFNWDALYDLLRDFHWIDQKGIILVHDDLPNLDKATFGIYMNVLIDSALDWKEGEDHYLEIVFSEKTESLISEYFKTN